MSKEEMMDRIKKLLAKAAGTQNEAESSLFYKKAGQLMEEWNITFSDIKNRKDVIKNLVDIEVEGITTQQRTWEAVLAMGIAQAFDCNTINRRFWNKWTAVFMGVKSDVDIAIYFYKFIRRSVGKMSKISVTRETVGPRSHLTKERNNYCYGMVNKVCDRLKEMYKARQEVASSDSLALIVVKGEELSKFVKEKFPNVKTRTANYNPYSNGYSIGQKDGEKIGLGRPLSGGQKVSQIG